jgi:hypothetical protein
VDPFIWSGPARGRVVQLALLVARRSGPGVAVALGQAGPQAAAPEEVVTVPVGAGVGVFWGRSLARSLGTGQAARRG